MSKVAILFFGIPRESSQTLPSLRKNVIEPLRAGGHEVRVFYHLYKLDRIINPRSHENVEIPTSVYAPFEAFTGEFEEGFPAGHAQRFAEISAYGDEWGDDFKSLNNLLMQLHSLTRVTRLAEAWQPECFFYLRPDLLYHNKVNTRLIKKIVADPRRLYLPSWQWWGGYNDRLALTGRISYRAYGYRMAMATQYCRHFNRPLHAEQLLKYALAGRAKIRVFSAFNASRVRANGVIKEESFVGPHTMGTRRAAWEARIKSTWWYQLFD